MRDLLDIQTIAQQGQQMQPTSAPPTGYPKQFLEQAIDMPVAPNFEQYDYNNPLSKGSIEAIKAAREHLFAPTPPAKPKTLVGGLLEFLRDANIASMRGSEHATLQHFGAMRPTSNETAAIRQAQQMQQTKEMLSFLDHAQKAREAHQHHLAQQYHQRITEEQMRPIREANAQEKMMNLAQRKEGIENANEFKKQYGVQATSILASPTSRQESFHKQHLKNADEAKALGNIMYNAQKLYDFANNEKTAPLFGSISYRLVKQFVEHPEKVTANIMNSTFTSEEDRTAILEILNASKALYVNEIKGVPARGINQKLEAVLQAQTPGAHYTADAVKNTIGHTLEETAKHLNTAIFRDEFYNQGLYIPPGLQAEKAAQHWMRKNTPKAGDYPVKAQGAPPSHDARLNELLRREAELQALLQEGSQEHHE